MYYPSGGQIYYLSGGHVYYLSGGHVYYLSGGHVYYLSGGHVYYLSGSHVYYLSGGHVYYLSGSHVYYLSGGQGVLEAEQTAVPDFPLLLTQQLQHHVHHAPHPLHRQAACNHPHRLRARLTDWGHHLNTQPLLQLVQKKEKKKGGWGVEKGGGVIGFRNVK